MCRIEFTTHWNTKTEKNLYKLGILLLLLLWYTNLTHTTFWSLPKYTQNFVNSLTASMSCHQMYDSAGTISSRLLLRDWIHINSVMGFPFVFLSNANSEVLVSNMLNAWLTSLLPFFDLLLPLQWSQLKTTCLSYLFINYEQWKSISSNWNGTQGRN